MSWTERYGVQPFHCFPVKIMRFCSSLLDEKPTEIQITLFVG